MIKFKKSFAILLIFSVFAPITSFGATIKIGETYSFNEDYVVKDNLYIGAGEAFSEGDVFGDLVIGAGNVTVSGNVSGDATIAGGDVSVLEKIQGDLRIIGGDILITKDVAGDLVIIGGNVRILSSATIGKDLVILGGRVLVQSDVIGKARIIGGDVTLNSKIGGSVDIKAGESINIGDKAVISGDLIYSGEDKSVLNISDKAVISGETIFKVGNVTSPDKARFLFFTIIGSFLIIKLITILVAVAFATIFLKRFSNAIAKDAIEHIGKKTLWGFVTVVAIPVATIVLFGSVFGIALGILGVLGYLMLIALASIYSGVIFGAWMDKLIRKRDEIVVNWKNGLLGVIALALIMQIPLIGGLAGLFFFLLTIGSISTLAYNHLWVKRK